MINTSDKVIIIIMKKDIHSEREKEKGFGRESIILLMEY